VAYVRAREKTASVDREEPADAVDELGTVQPRPVTGPLDVLRAAVAEDRGQPVGEARGDVAVARAVDDMPPRLQAYKSFDVDLGHLDQIDGAGAVLLARLFDRLDASGRRTHARRTTYSIVKNAVKIHSSAWKTPR